MKLKTKRQPTQFEQVLIDRDGMTENEARQQLEIAKSRVTKLIDSSGCSAYDAVEDFLLEEYGLEMDYIYDVLPGLF